MNVKFALISVWDKTKLKFFVKSLIENNYVIIASGGTYKFLKDNLGIQPQESFSDNITKVSDFTGEKELLNGRVKTLHPKIHAGILATPNDNYDDIKIDMVVCNLYPFNSAKNRKDATELIDIGGHTMLRAGAKNSEYTTVVCTPNDYEKVIDNLFKNNKEQLMFRQKMANKVWNYIYEYDKSINKYYHNSQHKYVSLKYGINPHQSAKMIYNPKLLKIVNGKPGYINMLDALLSWQLVNDLKKLFNISACASYKHNSPAGVALGLSPNSLDPVIKYLSQLYNLNKNPKDYSNTMWAYLRTRNCDPLSSFGDFIACNVEVDLDTAKMIKKNVSDGIIAPSYAPGVLDILKEKKKGNYLILQINPKYTNNIRNEYRKIYNCKLIQDIDDNLVTIKQIAEGSEYEFRMEELYDLVLAQTTVKYTQSNSVAIAYNGQVIGIGSGQQNRLDCIRLAGDKANIWCNRQELNANRKSGQDITNLINYHVKLSRDKKPSKLLPLSLASDGFLPFEDNIDTAHEYHIKHIVQPGGSIRDKYIYDRCIQYGIRMSCIGTRSFCH